MFEIKAQETGEILFKGSKKQGLKELEEWKQIKKFNGKFIPLQVYLNEELKAELNTNFSFNNL